MLERDTQPAPAQIIDRYLREQKAFTARLSELDDAGTPEVRIATGRRGESYCIASTEGLRILEQKHVDILKDSNNLGYIPPHIFGNLVAIRNFAPHFSMQTLQG